MTSLEKGKQISLEKVAGTPLSKVAMGVGWSPAKPSGLLGRLFGGTTEAIDLDAACLLFDVGGNLADVVWFRQLRSKDGSVVHGGDNLTGEGDGDDETIAVDLIALPQKIKTLVFTVSSFRGQQFTQVADAYCRMINLQTDKELARHDLTGGQDCTGVILAKVSRVGDGWSMTAIGEPGRGATFEDMMPEIQAHA
jgi:tellurium resistance protein TerZ